jgi:outer membrane protein assembly factor BamB
MGTNNGKPRDAAIEGDRGVVMAFALKDGAFRWQSTHTKLEGGAINDWPDQGVCSTPAVAGDTIYYLSNRAELVAVDRNGFAGDKDDGQPDAKKGPQAADILWSLDLKTLGVFPHHMAASSPAVAAGIVFVNTGNGVDEKQKVRAPAAPSFVAVDAQTGKLLWQSSLPGDKILDGQWASPSVGTLAGREHVVFPAGDGWLYAFDPKKGDLLWKFDASSFVQPPRPRESLIGAAVIAGDRVYFAVGHDPELGPAPGQLWALSVEKGKDGALEPKVAWAYGEGFSRTLSTPAVADGLVYAVDINGIVHCIDAATGKQVWTYDTFAAVWSSPLLADGKLYVGDEDGDVVVLQAGRTQKVLHETNLGNAIYASPTAVDGKLLIATRRVLYAFGKSGA